MMAKKKRGRGKRHKNVDAEGRMHAPNGTGKRNRNARRCTHYEVRTGRQCTRTVRVVRGRRPLCDVHVHRHRHGSKTRALVQHYQGRDFHGSMEGMK